MRAGLSSGGLGAHHSLELFINQESVFNTYMALKEDKRDMHEFAI